MHAAVSPHYVQLALSVHSMSCQRTYWRLHHSLTEYFHPLKLAENTFPPSKLSSLKFMLLSVTCLINMVFLLDFLEFFEQKLS